MFTVHSVPLFFAAMTILAITFESKLWRWIDRAPVNAGERVGTLDGLRGYLATAVFFHHASLYYAFLKNGEWGLTTRFYGLLGPVAVEFFFMITGFLFWSKAIDARGNLDFRSLYVNRVFRIVPLYLCAASAVVMIVVFETGFHLAVPSFVLFQQLAKTACVGLFAIPDLNGDYRSWIKIAGVTWTLRFEWAFYASLLLTSVAAKNQKISAVLIVAGLIGSGSIVWAQRAVPDVIASPAAAMTLFAGGMLGAMLVKSRSFASLSKMQLSCITIASLTVLFCACEHAYKLGAILLVIAAFLAIVLGGDLFGLLRARSSIRLGEASYGIYLLQGLVLYVSTRSGIIRSMEQQSAAGHWVFAMLTLYGTVIAACCSLVVLERPCIRLGRQVARKAQSQSRSNSRPTRSESALS